MEPLFTPFLNVDKLNPLLYKDLSDIALQYGPFFFSILFTLVFIPWAQKKYRKTATRTDPPPTERERKTYLWYFAASGIVSVFLITVCVIWWLSYQKGARIIQGVIQNVGEYVNISSPELYIKIEGVSDQPLKDLHFVYLYDTKTIPEDFRLFIRKEGSSEVSPLYIHCPEVPKYLKYRYIYEGDHKIEEIRELAENKSAQTKGFMKAAYASHPETPFSLEESLYDKNLITRHEPQPPQPGTIRNDWITRLQNERTPVGEKINLIDSLLLIQDKNKLEAYFYQTTDKEPFLITIMDLSRHSDPELAFKAKKLLDKTNSEKILADIIIEEDDHQKVENEILPRLTEQMANDVFTLSQETEEMGWLENYILDYEAGNKQQKPLYPTGSLKGDRYYVKATWNKDDAESVECLCQLFNRELISDRTIEQEREMMKDRNERIVYWYSKEWALSIARQIENCRAKAEFIKF